MPNKVPTVPIAELVAVIVVVAFLVRVLLLDYVRSVSNRTVNWMTDFNSERLVCPIEIMAIVTNGEVTTGHVVLGNESRRVPHLVAEAKGCDEPVHHSPVVMQFLR